MNILVLGGGAQGRVIGADLAATRPHDRITVADLAPPSLPPGPNLDTVAADLSDPSALARLLRAHDMVVGALPSRLGFAAMQAAIEARRPMVDVSFSAEDPLALDGAARRAGIAIVPDAGLAPGLSHLAAGRLAAAHGSPRSLVIHVGGVAEDRSAPYGYVVTWSLDDLMEEYVRPARVVRDGAMVTRPAFDELETIEIPGVGAMEAFLSDGLRTLLTTLPGVRTMSEKTLRWPGHVAAIRPLLEQGRLKAELAARCTVQPPRDLVVLEVRARDDAGERRVGLVARADAVRGLSAMARTTALTTSRTAQLMAEGGVRETGVRPLERLGAEVAVWDYMVAGLARHGLVLAGA